MSGSQPKKRARAVTEDGGVKVPANMVDGKKQKACLGCRRAKLRCIVKEGESCERCIAKGETCRFKIRAHDEKWQENQTERVEQLEKSMIYLYDVVDILSKHLGITLPPPPVDEGVTSPVNVIELPPPMSRDTKPKIGKIDYLTRSGTENLLAHATPEFAQQGTETRKGFFGLLDDLISSQSPEEGAVVAGSSHASTGSMDPRLDCVKGGIVDPQSAEVLVEFFHAHLAHHLMGFPLQLSHWPFLSEGKATMTPLIFGVTCLIAAERIPTYHHFVEPLETFLLESVLNVEPGKYFIPGAQTQAGALEPDLDLELGIGPEEISALCIYASFSNSPRSDLIAQTAFEWTRGYLKTYMNIAPPLTYGEALGLLPTRRDLSFENWLRLWLFAYVIDSQQLLHHETRPTSANRIIFDPEYFSTTLQSDPSGVISPSERIRDRELVSQARLAALVQNIQHVRDSAGWRNLNIEAVIESFDRWNIDIDRWWSDVFEVETETPMLQSTSISSTMFGLFAKMSTNLAAAQERLISTHPTRWRYTTSAARSARDILKISLEEPFSSQLSLLLPFYIKMISLSGAVLLGALQYSAHVVLPVSPKQACDLVHEVAFHLSNAACPRPEEGSRLMVVVDKMRLKYVV